MNIRSLDLNLLLVLNALYQERTVTATALQLGMSQPSVSLALAKLRDFFGDAMFTRTRDGMMPTPLAASLREPVVQIMATIEQKILPTPGFNPAVSRRRFTICAADLGEFCFLPGLTHEIESIAPLVSLRIVSMPTEDLKEALAAGSVDLAIGHFPDLDTASAAREELATDEFVCIVRKNHPIITDNLTIDSFVAVEHAMIPTGKKNERPFEGTLESLGLNVKIRVQARNFVNLPFVVASSDMIATIPRVLAQAFAPGLGLKMLKPPFDLPTVHLAQHWHHRNDGSLDIMWLRGMVRNVFERWPH